MCAFNFQKVQRHKSFTLQSHWLIYEFLQIFHNFSDMILTNFCFLIKSSRIFCLIVTTIVIAYTVIVLWTTTCSYLFLKTFTELNLFIWLRVSSSSKSLWIQFGVVISKRQLVASKIQIKILQNTSVDFMSVINLKFVYYLIANDKWTLLGNWH